MIAGNWKMHGLASALDEIRAIADAVEASPPHARVAIFPPATLISRAAALVTGLPVEIGGQDCRPQACGAYTGDIAPEMLADAGGRLVILGHSERRTYHSECDALVADKVEGALRAGLEPIVCVGETQAQKDAGKAMETITGQLGGSLPKALADRAFAVAYEPVWAIGTGVTPSLEEIEAAHRTIRANLVHIFGQIGVVTPILYGGSVKPANAAEILACDDVNGALVGGASLVAAEFIDIIQAA
jgi:triosephosphate isomerase